MVLDFGPARVLRDSVQVFDGVLNSLKHFKDDVREVAMEFECGIGLENYNDVRVDDIIENYEIIAEEAEL